MNTIGSINFKLPQTNFSAGARSDNNMTLYEQPKSDCFTKTQISFGVSETEPASKVTDKANSNEDKVIKWGILGTGKIANEMAKAIMDTKCVKNAELCAVASRTPERAEKFATMHHIPNHYGSYEELVQKSDVDVVYIATDTHRHYEDILLCLNNGKNVLCEKPLTLNKAQAEKVFALAKEKGLFLMEAYWSQFTPGYEKIRELIKNGEIGDVTGIEAQFLFKPEKSQHKDRLFSLNRGGGALLDVGFYTIGLALMVSGYPTDIKSETMRRGNGVDTYDKIILTHKNGSTSELICGIDEDAPRVAEIRGTKGKIIIPRPFHNPQTLTLKLKNKEAIKINLHPEGNGYNYEVNEVNKRIRNGETQSPIHSPQNTFDILEIMDAVRAKANLVYPQER